MLATDLAVHRIMIYHLHGNKFSIEVQNENCTPVRVPSTDTIVCIMLLMGCHQEIFGGSCPHDTP